MNSANDNNDEISEHDIPLPIHFFAKLLTTTNEQTRRRWTFKRPKASLCLQQNKNFHFKETTWMSSQCKVTTNPSRNGGQ